MGEANRNELIDRFARRLTVWIPLSNFVGALLALVSGFLTTVNIRHQPGFGRADIITFCVYWAAILPVGWWWSSRRSQAAILWLRQDRAPTEAEQREVLALPWRMAALSLSGWLGAAIVWAGLTGVSHSATDTIRVSVTIALGGITASGLTYLIVEWAERPIVTVALAGEVPGKAGPGVRLKLLLAWLIGADVFLVMVGLTFLGRPASEPPSEAAIWFIVAAGLVAGTVVLSVASRSLVTPLLELRRSVERVRRGDLDVQVPVNDGGELGLLQAGFNLMVGGLRERRALQDLFGRHVGEEVARRALDQGVALGGERREVSVVFVDVIDSTGLAWSHPPEEVVEMLNRLFEAIVRVVAAEGGWLNKFEGDGALCVFGAPASVDDHAARALRAARTIRRELLALAAVDASLDAGIGVSAGTVVAGNVGTEQRYEYTVIGTPVNEAARLTDVAKQRLGRILASEEAVSRAGPESASWQVADEVQLRGFTQPVLVYEPSQALRDRVP